jgi:hypothetical protein
VLTRPTAGPLIRTLSQFDCKLLKKDNQEGDKDANKDWGVTIVNEDGVPACFKATMMETILKVNEFRLLATEERDDNCSLRVFVN